jgi:hypothetical protein
MALMIIGERTDSPAKIWRYADLINDLKSVLNWSGEDIHAAVELFSAQPRESFTDPPPPFTQKDVEPWNFNRGLSYLHKPLLVRTNGDTDEVLWGSRGVYLAALNLRELSSSPRFKAKSPEMRSLISKRRQIASETFNNQVAIVFEGITDHVKVRVKKIGKHRIRRPNGEDLGDVDVLVAYPTGRKLLAIETKDLAIARTPAELGHELESVFESGDNRSADVDKHLERTSWLQEHLVEVLNTFNMPSREVSRWTVVPLLVTNTESLSPYLVTQRLRVVSIQQLKREIAKKHR